MKVFVMGPDLNRGRWSAATRAAYDVAWRDFAAWCEKNVRQPLPAEAQTIAEFLTLRSETYSTSTLSGRLAAIVVVHQLYGHEVRVKGSVIKDAWAEIRRRKGTAKKPKVALTVDDVKKIVRKMPGDRLQDRAVILFAVASLMRRSEIVALDREDLEFSGEGLSVTIRRSKTDKDGKGATIAILRSATEFCPVSALERWLEHASITTGPIFRGRGITRMGPRTVANIAKRWGKAAGYSAADIGAHSFRRGGITTMHRNGATIADIMQQSRHKTISVALGYVEKQQAALNPALRALRL